MLQDIGKIMDIWIVKLQEMFNKEGKFKEQANKDNIRSEKYIRMDRQQNK